MNDPVVIVSAVRTPIGAMQGALSSLAGHQLGALAIRAAVERSGLKPDRVEEAVMGCVLSAGQGQAPARQATLGAGLDAAVGATTVNKVCGSGMKAAMMAGDILLAGHADVVVAGGMESMSNAPFLLKKARGGYRYGHDALHDHMALDGLEDAYDKLPNGGGRSMGLLAESCAEKYGFTREQQDSFAIESTRRALEATDNGAFAWEIVPVAVPSRAGEVTVSRDEGPAKAKPDKIPTLKPAFKKDGTITAATASSISDGGAAVLLMRRSTAEKLGCPILATVVACAAHAQDPQWFTTAPVGAIAKLYDKTGWNTANVDLFEINEAFAVVTLAAMREHAIPHDKVNVHGGACALGHPIGASGARLIVSLIGALRARQGKRGIASLCIGGGEAVAMAIAVP
jgi:acetyl-CoA C-acetyltransferase